MSSSPVVIFMTSNGVGMGHISRQLAIILEGRSVSPVLFSLSGALPRVMQAQATGELPEANDSKIRYEYCPSREAVRLPLSGWRKKIRTYYRSYRWHGYLGDRIVALAKEVDAQAIIFDGVVPYAGLIRTRKRLSGVRFIWMRRGMWQKKAPRRRLDLSRNFDLTIEPGDFAQKHDLGPTRNRTDVVRISPISLTSVLSLTSQEEARKALNLPLNRKIVLVAPGSGALGSVEKTINTICEIVADFHPEWQIALTRQAIARHGIEPKKGLFVLDNVYPLARHLKAFDASISAAGYNSVHELLAAKVPTLFIPSPNHATDDQWARANGVASLDAALLSTGQLRSEIRELLSHEVQSRLRDACNRLPYPSGSSEAAYLVYNQATKAQVDDRKYDIKTPRKPFFDARSSSDKGDISEVRFTDTIEKALLNTEAPIEHIMPSTSRTYWQQRYRIASWLYRWDK